MTHLTTVSISFALLVGLAHADPKADPKAGAPAVPKDAKVEKTEPPKEMPKAPQELADMAKAMAGTWTCAGKADMGGTMMDIKGTATHKLDLDGWWMQTSITATMGKLPAMHMTFMTTYDAAAKKWFRETANSRGGHGTSWGTQADKKVAWEGDGQSMGADTKFRATEEAVSAKEEHLVGEYSKDGGKTWKPDHDITCKK